MHAFARWATLAVVTAGLWPLLPDLARAEPVGKVEAVQGKVTVTAGAEEKSGAVGLEISKGDRVRTESGARAVLKLADGTSMTLGENADVAVDDYVFSKASGLAVINLAKGALRFSTGLMGKLQDKRIEVRTPAATLAARGTEFWSGPIDGSTGVLLLKGEVEVRNLGGSVLLARRRQGTQVKDRNSAPESAKTWGDAKVRRALAATAIR